MRRLLSMSGILIIVACSGCVEMPNAFTALTPETHATFPIAAGQVHDGVDCNSCHGGLESFREFDCLGCHAHAEAELAPAHAETSGYVYESPACYQCHPDGTAGGLSRENHAPFPISAGSQHASIGCSACHLSPTDDSRIDCAACHQQRTPGLDSVHLVLDDYSSTSSPACLRCHSEGTVPITRAAHNGVSVLVSDPHDHCTGCHDTLRPDRPFFPAADFGPFSCYGSCHEHSRTKMDARHSGDGRYAYDFPTCLRCHPNAR